ncbi:7-cyano-7-deazaguanine synthase QueC [Kiloniella sp.]|uniref:7-cyano-7-deazaguanine synthase QueC n=1 Tax=Kiloniella sp. TaxID=1938587 RepID=UPI003A9315EC
MSGSPVAAYPVEKQGLERMKTLVICSGGLDSVTLAHKVAAEAELTRLISFDYGQRHKKELDYARRCAERLGVPHNVIDIANVGALLSGSALTDDVDVPDGHYEEESMKVTVVPNRNAIMLAIAFGAAAAENADAVAAAVHGGDHFIYPDCRPAFIDSFEEMQHHALDGYAAVKLYTPFVHLPKSDIAAEGSRLKVPFEDTWSCYKGYEHHCGRCGTCVERREAFHVAKVEDPTIYQDPDYWLEAVEKAKGV